MSIALLESGLLALLMLLLALPPSLVIVLVGVLGLFVLRGGAQGPVSELRLRGEVELTAPAGCDDRWAAFDPTSERGRATWAMGVRPYEAEPGDLEAERTVRRTHHETLTASGALSLGCDAPAGFRARVSMKRAGSNDAGDAVARGETP